MSAQNTDASKELRAMQFRTQLPLGGNQPTRIETNDLHKMLTDESKTVDGLSWGKLNKTAKAEKLREWVSRMKDEKGLSDDAVNSLSDLLTRNLDNGRFAKTRDVVYCVKEGKIEHIPRLGFCETKKRYTLRRVQQTRARQTKRNTTEPKTAN